AATPGGVGSPDVAWRAEDSLVIAFEAKTNEATGKLLDLEAIRQASTHLPWVHDNLGWQPAVRSETVIVGRHCAVDKGVTGSVAGSTAIVHPDQVLPLFDSVVAIHREVRAQSAGLSDDQLRTLLHDRLEGSFGLGAVADKLTSRRIADMPG